MKPPSTGRPTPITKLAAGLHSHSTAAAEDIAPAFIEMIDSKFKLDANTYYSEPKVVEPKEKV